jgi:hypothetical protein
MIRDNVAGSFKPKNRHPIEDATFVRDGSGQDNIKSAYSVCGDNQKLPINSVNVSDFTSLHKLNALTLQIGFANYHQHHPAPKVWRRMDSCDNFLPFWVKDFHLALAVGKFGKGDRDLVGDINWAIRFLCSVTNAFVKVAVMGRERAEKSGACILKGSTLSA